MTDTDDSVDLRGKLLVAMPGMGDPRFEKSVVFLCEHSDKGAMGLIVNKPTPGVTMDELLGQLSIEAGPGSKGVNVHFGGPVESGRGFVLHSSDYSSDGSTLQIDPSFAMTATLDILSDIAAGEGPKKAILALGYAGWAPGQLEQELQQNGWLTCDATPEIVFARDDGSKWGAALTSLGIDALSLSATAGRA